MADTLFKLKSGSITTMGRRVNGVPLVPFDAGTVYFAVDTTTHVGRIIYDVVDNNGNADRIVMDTHVEYSDVAGSADHATSASQAEALTSQRNIDGILFNGTANIIHYAECSSAADAVNKTVACSGFNLIKGARITVTFANTNTASNVTLNVQNTGAKAIYYRGAAVPASALAAKHTYEFVYDGTYYVLLGDLDTNTVYQLVTRTSDGLMSAADKDKLDGIEAGAKAGTVTSIATGAGLTGGTISTSGTIKTKLKSETKLTNGAAAATEVANRVYPVALDKDGNLAVNVPWVNTTYNEATKTVSGLMSDEDKTKLDGIEAGAQKNTITGVKGDAESSYRTGNVNITKANIGLNNVENKSSATIRSELTAANVNAALGYTAASDALATSTTAGLMSASDKAKIDAGLSIAGNSLTIGGTLSADVLRTSLGLSNAMHYIGIATVAITDGSTTNPTITGYDFVNNKKPGDVVIDKDSSREYVWSSSGKWEELGPDGSYALAGHRHANADTSTDGFMSASDKSKLNGIASGAQVNVLEGVKLNNTALTISSKTVNIPLMSAATASAAGKLGLVPAPGAGKQNSFLRGDGTWVVPTDTTYEEATTSVAGLMSANDKAKLDGIATNAQVNVLEAVKMNNAALAITNKTVNIPLMGAASANSAGSVGVVPAPGAGKQTSFLRGDGTWVVPTNTTYNEATQSTAGLMSADDKAKLDGIAENAKPGTVTSVATGIGLTGGTITNSGTIKVKVKSETASSLDSAAMGATANRQYAVGVDKSGYLSVNIPWSNTTYDVATTSTSGLLSADDKAKLDGIAEQADNVSFTQTLASGTKIGTITINGTATDLYSTNNTWTAFKGATASAAGTAGYINAVPAAGQTGLWFRSDGTWQGEASSTTAGLMSSDDKAKLDGIEAGAQVNTVTGVKGNSETNYRTGNINITKANIGLGNVENKSSATIRGELTKANVTTALGYTPATQDVATTTTDGLMDADDKAKLDTIAEGADNVTFTRVLSSGTKIGTITINGTATDIYSTNNTWNAFVGATANAAGSVGYINNAPAKGILDYYFGSDGNWHGCADTTTNGLMSAGDKSKLENSAMTIAGNTLDLGGTLSAATLRSSLGLSNAMHFIGKATVAITDGSTTDPTISGYSTKTAGDVVIDKDNSYEYVWTAAGAWERLGPDGSYALSNHRHDNASTSADGFMSSGDKSKLNSLQVATLTGNTPISVTNSGMAYTVSHATSGPSTSGDTAKGDTTNQSPTWGGTFKVTSGTVDKFGHTTAFAEHTVTIPNATASTTTAGLMSADDKAKLDGIAANAQTGTVTKVTAGIGLNTSADQADSATKGSITTTGTLYLTKSGVTAGSYGQSADYTEANNGTFTVPYITVDTYGRVTNVTNKTITAKNENNLVTNTLATTTKYYVTGTGSANTNTGTQYFDTGVYVTTTPGQLNAKTYKVDEAVTLEYNATTQSLDFIFA